MEPISSHLFSHSSSSSPCLLQAPSSPVPQTRAPASPCFHRKSHSIETSTQLIQDKVQEVLQSNSPPALRKTSSDPKKALQEYTSLKLPARPPNFLDQEIVVEHNTDLEPKTIFQNLFATYQNDPFIEEVKHKIRCFPTTRHFTFERENLTHPFLARPLKEALELHMQAYKKKYDINIQFSYLPQLTSRLLQIQRTLKKPEYISFIVQEKETEAGHVVPLLCSFGQRSIEFLLMDAISSIGHSSEIIRRAIVTAFPRASIFLASGGRQASPIGCRTGALSLLRNAHLYLRFKKIQEGLEILFNHPWSNFDVPLPSEWTYVEQIFRGETTAIAIRDLFSKQSQKRLHPRTIGEFRQQHSELVNFRCLLISEHDYTEDFQQLTPPPSVQALVSNTKFALEFMYTAKINTYLTHKGLQRAGLETKQIFHPLSQKCQLSHKK